MIQNPATLSLGPRLRVRLNESPSDSTVDGKLTRLLNQYNNKERRYDGIGFWRCISKR
jgi:hypothetical protein